MICAEDVEEGRELLEGMRIRLAEERPEIASWSNAGQM